MVRNGAELHHWWEAPTAAPTTVSTAGPAGAAAGGPPVPVGLVGLHGGAGVTRLAREIDRAVDLGRYWPDVRRGQPPQVVVVARTHEAGLAMLALTLRACAQGRIPPGVQVAGALLVADAPGRLPRQLARRIRVLATAVATHQVPWVPAWRLGDDDPAEQVVTAVRDFLGQVVTRTDQHALHTSTPGMWGSRVMPQSGHQPGEQPGGQARDQAREQQDHRPGVQSGSELRASAPSGSPPVQQPAARRFAAWPRWALQRMEAGA